jgi:hypothetical protein
LEKHNDYEGESAGEENYDEDFNEVNSDKSSADCCEDGEDYDDSIADDVSSEGSIYKS